ncbi:MAG: response regulator [Kiritimatiellae bacterium]|nr:response regulator [Kiritimatiellia bacterium]
MAGYSYSIFSGVAVAIHLIINFGFLAGRGVDTGRARRYRGFLFAVLVYYMSDAAWGLFAGLGWNRVLYFDTVVFFLSLPVFVFMWGRFVAGYLGFGETSSKILRSFGIAVIAASAALMAVNLFDGRIFYFDDAGTYCFGDRRHWMFAMLIALDAMISLFAFAKAMGSRDQERRRGMLATIFGVAVAVSAILQIVWPLTPFTALGCLVSNCFFHVFVIQDEQAARYAARLKDALERARAAEKARSMFFSAVSHHVRTPINAILGYAELLRPGTESVAAREEALDTINASGSALLELVDGVLDLAKTDVGAVELHPESVRIDQLTAEVFSTLKAAAAANRVELVDHTSDVPALMLDARRIKKILFNLAGNAVRFTDHGSATISASYSGGTLELAVADTGCGIPREMLSRVLDPFVQVQDQSHAPASGGGIGLGLAICKSLVEAMGGEIDVRSEPGKGSVFTVRIPCAEAADEAPPKRTEPALAPERGRAEGAAGPRGKPRRVLVADDSPINRTVLAAHLRKAGVSEVAMAHDGEEAFEKLTHARSSGEAFDIVFTDYWMPNMNGAELVEKLRADPGFARLAVYAVTADTECRADERFKLFDGVMLKPITAAKLADALAGAARRA